MDKYDLSDLVHLIADCAINDADLFVNEFDEPLDSAKTDWDSVAWGDVVRTVPVPKALTEVLWPFYSGLLELATQAILDCKARQDA